MQDVFSYLKSLEVNFLATRDGDSVSCRPFGDPVKFDNKIYILTQANKSVAKQLAADNHICIVAYKPSEENWLRIFCEAIDDSDNPAAKQAIIDEFDWAEEEGYTLTNPNFQALYIAEADATIYNVNGDILKKYTF